MFRWCFKNNVLKTLFSAQKSGSRLRCRIMLKKTWNIHKTPTKHVLRLFDNFLKIWFSAQKSGSRLKCRTMLKKWNTQKTPTKHVLRLFKNFLKIWFSAPKSGSWLRCQIMLKYHETLRKHQLNMFWGFMGNFWKIRFSAQISNYAKIPWNTQKTPTKHILRLLKKFVKIRFSAQHPVLGSDVEQC